MPQDRDINDLIALRLSDFSTILKLVFKDIIVDVLKKADAESMIDNLLKIEPAPSLHNLKID